MAVAIWGTWGTEWALDEKVSFNGYTKTITVNSGVTALAIRADVYSAWVRWTEREPWAPHAMRYSGGDPIPGGETGLTFFLINGWKLVYDPNVVAVSGVLYSEDYATAYWSATGQPVYPATVSALVNSAVSYQNVVTGDLSSVPAAVWGHATRTTTDAPAPTAAENATAVWAKALEGLTAEEMMRVMLAALAGKRQGLGTATEQYMGRDGTTPRITLAPDANGNGTPTINGAA